MDHAIVEESQYLTAIDKFLSATLTTMQVTAETLKQGRGELFVDAQEMNAERLAGKLVELETAIKELYPHLIAEEGGNGFNS